MPAPQTPSAAAPPAGPAKGSIEGTVVNSVSDKPVSKVTLMLSGKGAPASFESDENGRFIFRDLEAGRYTILGSKPGYATQMYGARSNPLSGTPLVLSEGQQLKDILFKLAPHAVITGKVTDETGEPVANAVVMALRSIYRRGRRQLVPLGAVQTDDLGQYRVPNLGPGAYMVAAKPSPSALALAMPAPKPSNGGDQTDPVLTYYPDSADEAGALPVSVAAGEERAGVDVRMRKARVFHVSGKVTGTTGGAALPLALTLRGQGVFGMAGAVMGVARQDGSFDIGGVAPGPYVLTTLPIGAAEPALGVVPVDVSDRNVENVTLSLGAGSNLPGTVFPDTPRELTEDARASLGKVQVLLDPIDTFSVTTPSAKLEEFPKFMIKGVLPTRYIVRVSNIPDGFYVKSIRLNSQEAPESQIDLGNGVSGSLEVVLADGAAHVTGVVRDGDGRPVAGATVALIPKSRNLSLFDSESTDQSGSFSFKNIRPGEYSVLAWEDIELGAYEDPEFLKRYENQAEELKLDPAANRTLALKVILPRQQYSQPHR